MSLKRMDIVLGGGLVPALGSTPKVGMRSELQNKMGLLSI